MENGDLIHHKFRNRIPPCSRNVYHDPIGCDWAGCYTVVKKARFEEQWPNDPAFQNFADRLANAVQTALFEGLRIRTADERIKGDYCTLGCLPYARESRRRTPAILPSIPFVLMHACFNAFDHGLGDPANPYVRLGLAYRKRFSQ